MKKIVTLGVFLVCGFFSLPILTMADTVKIYSHPSDLGVRTSPYPGSWDTQHSATVGIDQQAQQERALAYTAALDSDSGIVAIYRSFMSFDTASIPDDAEITSVKLMLYADTVLDLVNDQYAYMNVLQGFQASPTAVTFDDIEKCGDSLVNPTKGANDIDVSSITQNAYLGLELNSVGVGWVDKQGYTQLCVREGHDIENSEPVNNDGTWKESGITHYTSEAPGTSTDPYLEITYTVPDSGPTLDERIEQFRTTVLSYDLPKKVERGYLVQIRLLETSVKYERYKAALAQTLVLKLALGHDKRHRIITESEYRELLTQLREMSDILAELR